MGRGENRIKDGMYHLVRLHLISFAPGTKRWVTVGHSPEEQASMLKQIAEAEERRKMRYIISVPSGYYEIEYGLVKGGGSG